MTRHGTRHDLPAPALLAIASAWLAIPPAADAGEYAEGLRLGRAEARAELRDGRATIYEFGCVGLSDEHLDRDTGLLWVCLGDPDERIRGRIDGHNEVVLEGLRRGQVRNCFKPYERQLFALADYFEGRARREGMTRLEPGAQELRSPDGRYGLRLVRREVRAGDPSRLQLYAVISPDPEPQDPPLVLANPPRRRAPEVWLLGMREVDLLWGPPGSGFAVLRNRLERGGVRYLAISLVDAAPLRGEYAGPGEDHTPRVMPRLLVHPPRGVTAESGRKGLCP